MKLIIAGSRNFNDYETLVYYCEKIIGSNKNVEIVSGGCKGADTLGARFAKENGYDLKVFHADWNKHGRAAGPIRNKEMAKYANTLALFWDGHSRGSASMEKLAREENLSINNIIVSI